VRIRRIRWPQRSSTAETRLRTFRLAYANEPGVSDEETAARVDSEEAALWALAETEPQTIEGASRLLDYIANYDNGCLLTAEMHCLAMLSVASALRSIGGANA
jgi:hypothetical protein